MGEREAFYARLEAEFRKAEPDFVPVAAFADWLRDRGEDALADGYAATARLRVAIGGGGSLYFGLNSWKDQPERVRAERKAGQLWFVPCDWWDAAEARWDKEVPLRQCIAPFPIMADIVALAWGDLSVAQKREAEELLAQPEVALEHA